MEPKSIGRYINFGQIYRFLLDASAGNFLFGNSWILANINRFFDYLDEFKLPVTKIAAYKLTRFRDKWEPFPDKNKTLDAGEATKLREIMIELDITLWSETGLNFAYIVTDKRIDVEKLLNDVPTLFSPKIFKHLPSIAKYDFKEAGKCIAFGLPTAAAFHLLRGTEDTLRLFYCSIVKRQRLRIKLWAPMVNQLERRRQSPPPELLNNLDHIRKSYRNPTQHPDMIYNIEEVQDLFNYCVEVVNRMIKYLQKLQKDKKPKSKS